VKTQIAAVALAVGYSNLGAVVAGTTCGMLLANAPVVFLGKAFATRPPLRAPVTSNTLPHAANGLDVSGCSRPFMRRHRFRRLRDPSVPPSYHWAGVVAYALDRHPKGGYLTRGFLG
jgi:hypothetical protein